MPRFKILVAGRSGQLASALAEIRVQDMELAFKGRREMDIRETESVAQTVLAVRPDLIINTAAWTDVDGAEHDPDGAFALNALGAANLAAAAEASGIALFHISTDYVFSGEKDGFYSEDDAPAPLNIYGESKRAGDTSVLRGKRNLVLRVPWLHMPGHRNFITAILAAAESRDELKVVRDQIGTPAYAPDVAALLIDLARRVKLSSYTPGLFHLGSPDAVSRADLARFILSTSRGLNGPFANVESILTGERNDPATRPLNSRLDGAKLTRFYGWQMPDWREGVRATIERQLATYEGVS